MLHIGYFLLLFFCVSANVVHSMDFSMQKEQCYTQTHISLEVENDDYFTLNLYFQPQTSATNSLAFINLSNPNTSYDFQSQEKNNSCSIASKLHHEAKSFNQRVRQLKKRKGSPLSIEEALAALLMLKHSTPSNEIRKLALQKKTDKPTSCTLTKRKIAQALKKIAAPKEIPEFKVACPFETCEAVLKSHESIAKLKSNILVHFSSRKHINDHPKVDQIRKLIQKIGNFKKYFKKHGKAHLIPNPDFNPNPNKKRKLQKKTDTPTCEFTFECPSCRKNFHSTSRFSLKKSFVNHAEKICKLPENEIAQTLKNIVDPEKIREFQIQCPLETCDIILRSHESIPKLKGGVVDHFHSKKHMNDPKRSQIYESSIRRVESFKEYFNQYGKTLDLPNPNFVSNPNKRRKLQHSK